MPRDLHPGHEPLILIVLTVVEGAGGLQQKTATVPGRGCLPQTCFQIMYR